MGHRLWLPAVAVHRLGVVEIAPSPHHCFRMAHPCAQSVKRSPTVTVTTLKTRKHILETMYFIISNIGMDVTQKNDSQVTIL